VTTPDPYAGFAPKSGSTPTGTADPNAVYLYTSGDSVRLEVAKLLKAAGYNVPQNGKYSDALVNAYTDAVQKAALQSQRLGRSFTVREYLTQEQNTGGTGTGTDGKTNYISDPTQAAGTVRSVIQGLLNRDATDKEVEALGKILVDAQKKNPYITKNGVRVGGLDDKEFLTELIQSGSYKDNKKAYPKLLKGLAEEVKTKKQSAVDNIESQIRTTAMDNNISATPQQLSAWANRVQNGEDIKTIQNEIRNAASLGYSDQIKKLMSTGTNLSTILSPYKEAMASTLGLNPATISLNDPTLHMALSNPNGKEMNLFEYQTALRKDPRWQYTDQARSEAADVAQKVLKDFGFMG
jgi:ribose 5-phosphate isomerase RpiB